MASIYVKQGKYWLKYLDPIEGRWKDKPTPLRFPADARKARQLKLETTAGELKHKTHKVRYEERWNAWVPDYLRSRYASGKTYDRYSNSWTHLGGFLEEKGITVPAAWKAEHNAQYVTWKEDQGYSREVAIWDLGALAMLMNEAKRREFISAHKVSKSRIKRGDKAEKPALTDTQIAVLRTALAEAVADPRNVTSKNSWANLSLAFEIALHTGCRLAETSIPFNRINLERETITFLPKGGKDAMFTAPIIFPTFKIWLIAIMDQRRRDDHSTTCDISSAASRDFGRLCRKLGLKGPNGEKVTFHCLRVTFVTRAFEAGLSGEIVRKLVNHSDVIVNRLYQRFSIEGLQALGAKLNLPVVMNPGQPDTSFAKTKPQKRATSHQPRGVPRRATGKASIASNPKQRRAQSD